MSLKWKAIGLLLVLGGLAEPANAQTTPLFRMNCGSNGSNWPQCGFDVYDTSATQYYRRSRVPAGSPSGSDATQFDFIPTTATNLDFGYGWGLTSGAYLAPVPQGGTRYIRYRLKINSPVNWRTASDSRWASKIVILGNTCENSAHQPTRVIQMLRGPGDSVWTQAILNFSQNIDTGGLSDAGPFGPLPIGQWINIQLKIQSSSTTSTADGRLYSYYNNNNEGAPTMRSSSGIVLRTSGWSPATCSGSHMILGGSAREVMAGANLSFQLADFEYDDAFDPNWDLGSAGGSVSSPAAPSGLRIVSGAGFLPLSAVISLLGYRLRRSKHTTKARAQATDRL